jgi:hypothetical protein
LGAWLTADTRAAITEQPRATELHAPLWSLQPPHRPAVPTVKVSDRIRTPIDAFILAQLEARGLVLASDADRLTLMRRAYLDLIGLPPSPPEIDSFLADKRSDAYERLIDRLLESSHYGERWGRHWLDIAGYSDSRGILVGEVPRPTQYLYRDYVIRAFRDDKPYDRFLLEQIAGDELVDFQNLIRSVIDLPADAVDAVIATGFLRNSADASRPDFANIKHAPMYYFDTLNDAIAIVSSATLGLTLQCAKCHDHKYDPISQRDFYEMQAIFKSGYRPEQWIPEEHRYIEWATEVEMERAATHNRPIQSVIDKFRAEAETLHRELAEKLFMERLAKLPEQIREDVKQSFGTDEKSRNEIQKYLVGKFQKELKPSRDELLKLDAEFKTKSDQFDAAVRGEEAKKKVFTKMRALYDLPGEPTTHLLKRGDWRNPGDEVQPGVPAAIATPLPFRCPQSKIASESVVAPAATSHTRPDARGVNQIGETSSGRRLAFARWLTQPEHPLTARVMVNRIWLHHFGEGLVGTPDDFGSRGSAPTHPELLDWLATEFVARGWSIKAMHRLIMTSSVYRQSSQKTSQSLRDEGRPPASESEAPRPPAGSLALVTDPTNRLLWHFPLRRLDAESIRDSVLAASGMLNRAQFGPAIPLVTRPDGEVVAPDSPDGMRRSIYLFVGRKVPVTMLHLFDQPMVSVNCPRRSTSTLASQALDLLNSDFMIKQAEQFAERLLREAAPDRLGQPNWDPIPTVTFAFKSTLGRTPTDDELREAVGFLNDQAARYVGAAGDGPDALRHAQRGALADFGHMLLSANEFVYVD